MCNIAITRYATARVFEGAASGRAVGGERALVEAALRRAGLRGVAVTLTNDFPVGAGLGGSSAASAAILSALNAWRRVEMDPGEMAEEGRRIEVEDLGVAGGRQDHYAATHGGALGLTFNGDVAVRRIPLAPATRDELLACSTLIYTGESRISGDTITAVLGAYEAGVARVVTSLRRMRELAVDMASALGASDIHALGELVDEHWTYQRALHPSIPTPRIDDIISRARAAGAIGAKAMGASGGGCVYVLSRPGKTAAIREAVRDLGEILSFDFDTEGSSVLQHAA